MVKDRPGPRVPEQSSCQRLWGVESGTETITQSGGHNLVQNFLDDVTTPCKPNTGTLVCDDAGKTQLNILVRTSSFCHNKYKIILVSLN